MIYILAFHLILTTLRYIIFIYEKTYSERLNDSHRVIHQVNDVAKIQAPKALKPEILCGCKEVKKHSSPKTFL